MHRLGWHFEFSADYPGPMVSFMFECRAIGGDLRGSEEGDVKVFPVDSFPVISSSRGGSLRLMETFLRHRVESQARFNERRIEGNERFV